MIGDISNKSIDGCQAEVKCKHYILSQRPRILRFLVNMQLNENKDVLDLVDRLRSQGLSHYVDLPQIIVCGDQSSGKSSILEAISGLQFPHEDDLCTRFTTEVAGLLHAKVDTTGHHRLVYVSHEVHPSFD